MNTQRPDDNESLLVPSLSPAERQKLWGRVLRFAFTDVLLSILEKQQMITVHEHDHLSLSMTERCGIPSNSIFRSPDYLDR